MSVELQNYPAEVDDKKDIQVKVNCTCPAFVYQGVEYNLNKQDALLGRARGNLQPPKKRDPVQVNYGCKHIFASVRQLLNSFKLSKPLADKELEKPETPQATPFAPSPFTEEKPTTEKFSPFEDRIFSKEKEVPKLLLPKEVDTKAVEEMEEEPSVIPRLFERKERKQEVSPFRKKTDEEPIEALTEREKKEDGVGKLPSQKPLAEETPEVRQETDDEDEVDALEALRLKREKREEDKKKLNLLLSPKPMSAE